MKRGLADQLRKGGELYPLCKMFFDIGGSNSLLPPPEPATDLRLATGYTPMETQKLIHEYNAECFKIELIS